VIRTRVGYAGGTSSNPGYYDLADHSEAIQFNYDPDVLSYPALLEIFWGSHDPTLRKSTQYMSRVFYHTDSQCAEAALSREKEEKGLGIRFRTELMPYTQFYLAEDYHQKYYLRQNALLMADYAAIYPETSRLIQSTAAARVNGFAGGNGTRAGLQAQIGLLGLSERGKQELLLIARKLPEN